MNTGQREDCAVVLRVSTGHQDVSNQIPDVERFVAHHGWHEAMRYEISESAWNGGKDNGEYRATIAAILDDAWAGKFSVLVVWALDRITREGAEGALRIIRQLRERGCILVSIKESWLNASPEIQDVLVAFAGWQAQMESQRRSDRIRAGLARRKREGKPHGGRKPGAKDRRPRSSNGIKAGWGAGGPLREARERAGRVGGPAQKLTDEQVAQALVMRERPGEDGQVPTWAQIAAGLGVSRATLNRALARQRQQEGDHGH